METKMLSVDLHGPFSLLPDERSESLLAVPAARGAGLFLWTIEHNRAHRIHFVGVAADSIAEDNMTLVSQILLGARPIYDQEKMNDGELEVLADSTSNSDQQCLAAPSALDQIRRVKVFFAPTLESQFPGKDIDKLVCDGIIRKLLKFGEIPTAWLEHSLRQEPTDANDHGLTVRFQRPAFIASLPDEMYL